MMPRFLSQTVVWTILNGNLKAGESILFAMGPVTLIEPPCAHAMIQAVFEACIKGEVFPNIANIPIQDANEALLALWTALACSSPQMVKLLLSRIRYEREHGTLLRIYTQMWDDYFEMLADVKIGWDDVLNLKALYDLASSFRTRSSRWTQVAKAIPSNMVSMGEDWYAITKPDLDKQLRASLDLKVVWPN